MNQTKRTIISLGLTLLLAVCLAFVYNSNEDPDKSKKKINQNGILVSNEPTPTLSSQQISELRKKYELNLDEVCNVVFLHKETEYVYQLQPLIMIDDIESLKKIFPNTTFPEEFEKLEFNNHVFDFFDIIVYNSNNSTSGSYLSKGWFERKNKNPIYNKPVKVDIPFDSCRTGLFYFDGTSFISVYIRWGSFYLSTYLNLEKEYKTLKGENKEIDYNKYSVYINETEKPAVESESTSHYRTHEIIYHAADFYVRFDFTDMTLTEQDALAWIEYLDIEKNETYYKELINAEAYSSTAE